jgi:hypothetical protein
LRIKFAGVLEGLESFVIVLCLRTGETQKEVSLPARRALFELFKDFALRFLNASFVEKLLGFREGRRRFGRLASAWPSRRRLLPCVPSLGEQNHRQR